MGALGKLARFAVRALEDEAPAVRRAVKRAPSPTVRLPGQLDALAGYDVAHRQGRLNRFAGATKVREPAVTSRDKTLKPPARVYHGTRGDFNKFEVGRPSTNFHGDLIGNQETKRHALFFAEDPAFSEEYIRSGRTGLFEPNANIMPVYLRAENPFDMTDQGLYDRYLRSDEGAADFDRTIGQAIGYTAKDLYRYPADQRWEFFDDGYGADLVDALRGLGHDSVYMHERHPSGDYTNVWGVFDPTQVKSVFNRGSFDPNDPDVLKARGGLAVKRKKR